MKKKYLLSLILVTIVSICTVVISSGCAQSLFYYPDQIDYGYSPHNDGLLYENIDFASHDGTILNAWFVPATGFASPDQAKGTVILVHGNGGNITASWSAVNWLPSRGYNVFTFDYRGYGRSQGRPTPQGLFEDTQAAVAYVRQRSDIDPNRLFIIGQSLGGNNTIAAIGATNASMKGSAFVLEHMKQGIRAIVIDSTFFSYSSIANTKIPGAGLLMNDDYSAARHVAALAPIPLLFLHGTSDGVVPYEQGQRLFEMALEPKLFITIPNGQHITALSNLYGDTYKNQVLSFFENALQSE